MRLWTIQPLAVWEELQVKRSLYAKPRNARFPGPVPPSYLWLKKEMRRRIPGYGGHFPWWAHCAKPDLRWVRHVTPAGSVDVRIELEIPPEALLQFPCWAWHTVYCQDFLAKTREEHEAWEARLRQAVPDEDQWPLPEPWRSELQATWQRLFDPDLPPHGWDDQFLYRKDPTRPRREAVFETLRLDEVRRVTLFRGTATWAMARRDRSDGETASGLGSDH